MKNTVEEQTSFLAGNGCISPCPYREKCGAYKCPDGVDENGKTYKAGCNGNCYWCKRFEKKEK